MCTSGGQDAPHTPVGDVPGDHGTQASPVTRARAGLTGRGKNTSHEAAPAMRETLDTPGVTPKPRSSSPKVAHMAPGCSKGRPRSECLQRRVDPTGSGSPASGGEPTRMSMLEVVEASGLLLDLTRRPDWRPRRLHLIYT